MKRLLRKLIPNFLINYGKHLPEALLANLIYRFPSHKLTVIGVTGTDGKTTTANLIYRILNLSGKKVSLISTINAVIDGKSLETGFHVTNPGPFALQKIIKKVQNSGNEYLVLETTSQGLVQFRNWGIKFKIGVITNITRDHFDYHKNFTNYRKAKAILIKHVQYAVLNRDDKNFDYLKHQTSGKVISVSLRQKADINLKNFPLKLKLPGEYNQMNALEAAAVGQILRIDHKTIKKALESVDELPGRWQKVANKRGIMIIIDFAHTGNGVFQVLTALKKVKKGRLIALVGAEGERDEGKRVPIGENAAKLADITIITAVDPRGQIKKINQQILEGAIRFGGELGKNVFVEEDRKKAIKMALDMAKKGDTVALLGKGHEQSMNINGKSELPWSEKEAVLEALARET